MDKIKKPFLKYLVNSNQSPEERRAKYYWLKQLGYSAKDARQMRDWPIDTEDLYWSRAPIHIRVET